MRPDNEGGDRGLLSAAAHPHRASARPVPDALREQPPVRARIPVHGVREASAGAARLRAQQVRDGRAVSLRGLFGHAAAAVGAGASRPVRRNRPARDADDVAEAQPDLTGDETVFS